MKKGVPVVDWTGLIKTEERRGFKPVKFTMPEDGYISLQILNAEGQVVCQLLNQAWMTKGEHEVQWDGLTTRNYHTPGQSRAAGQLLVAGDLAQGHRAPPLRLGLQRRQRPMGFRPDGQLGW